MSWLIPTLQSGLVLTTASLEFHAKWSAVSNWRRGSTVVIVPLNLLTWFWLQPGPYTQTGGERREGSAVSDQMWTLCLCGCRAQHTGITQDAFYNSAQGPWQQLQFSHTHRQRGNLSPCSWNPLTSQSSCRSPGSCSHGMQDLILLAMEISVGVNMSILSGTGQAKLVGNTSIIFGKILNSHQIGT